jgi:hypothetical protein
MLRHSEQAGARLESYLRGVRAQLEIEGVPPFEQQRLLERARAQLELELELAGDPGGGVELGDLLARMGTPAALAQQLRATAPRDEPLALSQQEVEGRLTVCRSCRREVSRDALTCPHCGAPFPARQAWRGWGYEWKSRQQVCGYPLVYVAFGRDSNGRLRVAKGFIAVGQFGVGAITVAQFGVGFLLGLGQFTIAPLALGQFAFGLVALGQFGIGLLFGAGQFATGMVAKGLFTLGNWFRGG